MVKKIGTLFASSTACGLSVTINPNQIHVNSRCNAIISHYITIQLPESHGDLNHALSVPTAEPSRVMQIYVRNPPLGQEKAI